MRTRREVVRQVGTTVVLGTTAPWWLVRRAHAARREKLIVWMPVTQAGSISTCTASTSFDNHCPYSRACMTLRCTRSIGITTVLCGQTRGSITTDVSDRSTSV